jgi:spore coat protein A, manganese oxidase
MTQTPPPTLQRAEAARGKKLSRRNLLVTAGVAALGIGGYTAATTIGNSGAGFEDDSAQSFRQGVLTSGIRTMSSQLTLPAPFQVPLPIPALLAPRATADADYYELAQSVAEMEIIPGFKTPIWGYNGTFPGPTIVSTSGRKTVVTHHNQLPVPTVTHLHGGKTPPDQDGYTTDYLLPATMSAPPAMASTPGMPSMADPDAHVTFVRRDYAYPMQQRAATLWYHDHRMGFTGPSITRGLAGFHIIHDEEERALPLPTADRDIPLMICDRAFAADGSFLYPSVDASLETTPGVSYAAMMGVMGDVVLVNGAPWPVLRVGTARYRFRILNASNARTYQLALQAKSGNAAFTQIGTDGGLLAAPIRQPDLVIAPAQRFDVVIDFGNFAVGDEITMINQADGGSVGSVMRFIVDRTLTDTTSIPAKLSTVDKIDPASVKTHRTMDFNFDSAAVTWVINGHPFDPQTSDAAVKNGDTELWTISSNAHHPIHIHVANLQVITRNGGPPGPFDAGWKDTVLVGPHDTVQVAARFTAYPGRYMFHCHNLEHEDMAMMANYHIID